MKLYIDESSAPQIEIDGKKILLAKLLIKE